MEKMPELYQLAPVNSVEGNLESSWVVVQSSLQAWPTRSTAEVYAIGLICHQTCQSLCMQTRTVPGEVPAGPMAICISHVSIPGLRNFPFNIYNTVGFPCNQCSGEENEAGTFVSAACS